MSDEPEDVYVHPADLPLPKLLDELERAMVGTSPGPWAYNSYSLVASVPNIIASEEVWDDFIASGTPYDDEGNFPEPWESRYEEVSSAVCWVPASHGDTATGRHQADASFISVASPDVVQRLIDRIRDLEESIAKTMREAWKRDE